MFSIDKFTSIRSSGKLLLGSSRKTRIISVSALLLAACAFGAAGVAPLVPDASSLPVKSITEELALPHLSDQIAELAKQDQHYVSEAKVRPGDTLAALMTRLGIDDEAAANFIKSDNIARAVLQLKTGKVVQAKIAEDGDLEWLSAAIVDGRDDNPVRNVVIQRSGNGFKAFETAAKLERRIEMRSGEIKSSLFAATDDAQIPDNVSVQIVDMFSTEIDFRLLRRGDRFNVVYETFWQNGELLQSGRVLAAEFVNAGTTYQSVWFEDPNNRHGGGYYGFDGKSLKKAFLKSPLEFSRISSGFSMRMHPISGQWKQHKGVDFAAAIGTPIRAAADGVVDFIGGQNGYGNVVVLKHWSNYSTAYAHMSRFMGGLHKGTKISQGQVIGYVGMTGWATGPHLHYEFRVQGEPRNPLAMDVPNAQPLSSAEMQRFRAVASDMSHRFALLSPDRTDIKLASR